MSSSTSSLALLRLTREAGFYMKIIQAGCHVLASDDAVVQGQDQRVETTFDGLARRSYSARTCLELELVGEGDLGLLHVLVYGVAHRSHSYVR